MAIPSKARLPVILVWLTAIFIALQIYLMHDITAALGDAHLSIGQDAVLGRDFANVYTAGRLALEGKLQFAYDVQAYQAFQLGLFDGEVRGHNYSYSPISFAYVWLFGLLPYVWSYLAWTAATGALFVIAARPYLRDAGLPGWAALLLPAALINIWAGHYGFLIGALWLGAWHWIDRRPRLAGVLVGLMIIKPHLAIVMPFVLAQRGAWRAFASAGVTVVATILLSALIFGADLWRTYLTETSAYQVSLVDDVGTFFMTMMPTVTPSLFLAGLPAALAWPIQIAISAAALILLLVRMPTSRTDACFAAAAATFLILPYAFIYDMTVLSVAAAVMLQKLGAGEDRLWYRLTAYLAFTLPLTTIFCAQTGFPFAPAILALQFAALIAAPRAISVRPAAPAALGAARSA